MIHDHEEVSQQVASQKVKIFLFNLITVLRRIDFSFPELCNRINNGRLFQCQSATADWIKGVKETVLEFVVTKMTISFHIFRPIMLQDSLIAWTCTCICPYLSIYCSIFTSICSYLYIISVLLCLICVILLIKFRLNLKPGKTTLRVFLLYFALSK